MIVLNYNLNVVMLYDNKANIFSSFHLKHAYVMNIAADINGFWNIKTSCRLL
jgi:hypothetical protein